MVSDRLDRVSFGDVDLARNNLGRNRVFNSDRAIGRKTFRVRHRSRQVDRRNPVPAGRGAWVLLGKLEPRQAILARHDRRDDHRQNPTGNTTCVMNCQTTNCSQATQDPSIIRV